MENLMCVWEVNIDELKFEDVGKLYKTSDNPFETTPTDNTHLTLKAEIKINVTLIKQSPKSNLLLLVSDKLIFFDIVSLKPYKLNELSNVSDVSYNYKANHIISICAENQQVVFDIKKRENIIQKKIAGIRLGKWIPFEFTEIFLLINTRLSLYNLANDRYTTIQDDVSDFNIVEEENFYLYVWNTTNLYKYKLEPKSQILVSVLNLADVYHFKMTSDVVIVGSTS